MAGAIVDFVVGKLKEQAFQEVLFQWKIKDEVEKITARLANMKGYVDDSGKGKQDTNVAESWATQLRDTTLELEDLVEEFMLDSKLVKLNTPPCNFCEVKSLFANVQSLVERVKIQFFFHRQLKAMDEKLLALETDKSNYSIKLKTNDERNELLMGSGSGYMVEIEAVGIDKQVDDIAELIQKNRRARMLVITVWGAGGCGKTTLAKQVYERVKNDESIDCFSWVDVNHSSDIEFVLRETINGLYQSVGSEMPPKLEKADENSLQLHICDYLKGKRYVVFFDDVWDEKLLSKINIPLHPASAIIITSRDKGIASGSFLGATPHCVEVKPLEPNIACELFCKFAFAEGNWPNETVKELGEALVERCTGLPVAILAMARLMYEKGDNPAKWRDALKSLDYYSAEFEAGGSLASLNRALLLSYYELPTHLKSCFLYCAMFPKTQSVPVKKLIRMCIAEGFMNEEAEHSGRALEGIARDYLLQLNNRSLIRIVTKKSIVLRVDDEIEMHDLFRDVAGEVIRREMFAEIKLKHNTKLEWKQRRSLIFLESKQKVDLEMGNMKKLRTLIIVRGGIIVKSLPQMLQNMKLLRVLALEWLPGGQDHVKELPNEVGDLINLRYISLYCNFLIRRLPDSLGRLHNLQTLDLRVTLVKTLPKCVSQLMQLRHFFGSFTEQAADDIVFTSSQLQTLSGMVINTIQARELVSLTQLTELDITFKEGEECWRAICDSVEKMTNLCSLFIWCQYKGDGMVWEFGNFSPPLYLEKMVLRNLQKLVKFTVTLNYLHSINIEECYVDGDFLNSLEKLPSLVCLYIGSYSGEQLLCSDGSFQKLEKLVIVCEKLTKWEIGKGAMKYLESLTIRDCYCLEMLPEGLREVEYLKELHLSHPSQQLIQGISVEGSDRWKIEHIPRVTITTKSTDDDKEEDVVDIKCRNED